jgi:hypothetical protein
MSNQDKNEFFIQTEGAAVLLEPLIDSENPALNVDSIDFSYRKTATDNDILRRAVYNLTRMLRLSEEYAFMLQGGISKEEYKQTALSYARTPREDVSGEEIAHEAKLILDTANMTMSSSELADILDLDVVGTENALVRFSKGPAVVSA